MYEKVEQNVTFVLIRHLQPRQIYVNWTQKTYVTACVLDVKQSAWPNKHVNVSAHLQESVLLSPRKYTMKWTAEFQIPRTGTRILSGPNQSLSWLAKLYHAFISKHNVVMGTPRLGRYAVKMHTPTATQPCHHHLFVDECGPILMAAFLLNDAHHAGHWNMEVWRSFFMDFLWDQRTDSSK
jgi:hypothetical protein